MYNLPNDMLLLIFKQYSLKNVRLINHNMKNIFMDKYYTNTINITYQELKDYMLTDSISQDRLQNFQYVLKSKSSYDEFIYTYKHLISPTRKIPPDDQLIHIDLITQYEILSKRINNPNYYKAIKINKLIYFITINNQSIIT